MAKTGFQLALAAAKENMSVVLGAGERWRQREKKFAETFEKYEAEHTRYVLANAVDKSELESLRERVAELENGIRDFVHHKTASDSLEALLEPLRG